MSVLVVGEALVDVIHGRPRPGGSPMNVAVGLARLGVSTTLHTNLGRDDAGLLVERHLRASGVMITPESWTDAPTSVAEVKLDAAGDSVEEEFCQALACESEGVESLTLRVLSGKPTKALARVGEGSNGHAFTWGNTSEDWEECVAKVDGLLEQNRPGHQYLTREDLDDALVEVCYREERFG